MIRNAAPPRRGFTMIWAVVVLSVVTAMTATLSWQIVADRRAVEQRRHQAQSLWLARAGIERAAERLLRDPAGYTEETVELLPRSQVRIVVRTEEEGVLLVTSEGRYPTDDKPAVTTRSQRFRRTVEKGEARLEPVTATAAK
jgi:type II secretory pathway pseudopilin PulG